MLLPFVRSNRNLGHAGLRIAVLLLFVTRILSAAQGRTQTPEISGHVLGGSGKHAIYVALWRADDFLKSPAQQIRIDPGAQPVFHFTVSSGRWAVSAYEDNNENGRLDMGILGPKEPSGFWRRFTGWHKPRFDEVAVSVTGSVGNADIVLK